MTALSDLGKQQRDEQPTVVVTVSGPVGSGKSRIAHEIHVALKAVGIEVSFGDLDDARGAEAEAHSEATGGWQPEMPLVLLQEMVTPASIADGFNAIERKS